MSHFVPENSSSIVANATSHSSLLSLLTGGFSVASTSALPLTSSGSEEIVRNSNELKRSKPKRPLSAYNLFFQDRRKQIMVTVLESDESLLDDSKQSNRKSSKKKTRKTGVGFANLARTIGAEWRALAAEKKAPYMSLAANDKGRYDKEMKVYRAKEKEEKLMRESAPAVNTQSFSWPSFAPITASRQSFGEDVQSMRNETLDMVDIHKNQANNPFFRYGWQHSI